MLTNESSSTIILAITTCYLGDGKGRRRIYWLVEMVWTSNGRPVPNNKQNTPHNDYGLHLDR